MAEGLWRRYVTETSATLSDMGAPLGEVREEDGQRWKLCQAGAAIQNKQFVQLDSVSLSAGYIVEPAYATASPIVGINVAGQSCAENGYLWIKVRGTCTVGADQFGTDATIASAAYLWLNSDKRLAAFLTASGGTNAPIVAQNGPASINSGTSGTTNTIYVMGLI